MHRKHCHIDRLFHYLRWSLGICLGLFCIVNIYLETHAEDLLERAFYQAKTQETIINLGDTKNAVGNEVLKESVGLQSALGIGCFVNGQKLTAHDMDVKAASMGYVLGSNQSLGQNINGAINDTVANGNAQVDNLNQQGLVGNVGGTISAAGNILAGAGEAAGDIVSQENKYQYFCQTILGGDRDVPVATTVQAPLIVRIAKWMLRLTIVLSITMVIFNGVMYIVESAKGGDVKDATKNLGLIVAGILVALLSLGIINLISSIGISTLK